MNRTQLRSLLESLQVRPSRALGQNFLVDANMLSAMLRDTRPRPGEHILEIGPGTGILTDRLLEAGCCVTTVELDRRLAAYLADKYAGNARITIHQGDACKLDCGLLMHEQAYRCVANLPYAVSTILIAHLIGSCNPPGEFLILLQREMADRLHASTHSKDYGAVSVQVQSFYEVKVLRLLPPEVFFPPPLVQSAFVRMKRLSNPIVPRERVHDLAALVRTAFSQRRKMVGKTLARRYGAGITAQALDAAHVPPSFRPEQITPPEYARILSALRPDGAEGQ